MAKKKHVVAVFTINDNVPQFENDVNTLKEALTTPPGNTRVTIAPAVITQLETDMAALQQAQADLENGKITAADRDIALDVVKTEVRGLVATVQTAADNAPDEQTSIAVIQDCGLRAKSRGAFVKLDIEVKNDGTSSGVIHFISKAARAGVKAAYEWQYSLNGINFPPVKIWPASRTT